MVEQTWFRFVAAHIGGTKNPLPQQITHPGQAQREFGLFTGAIGGHGKRNAQALQQSLGTRDFREGQSKLCRHGQAQFFEKQHLVHLSTVCGPVPCHLCHAMRHGNAPKTRVQRFTRPRQALRLGLVKQDIQTDALAVHQRAIQVKKNRRWPHCRPAKSNSKNIKPPALARARRQAAKSKSAWSPPKTPPTAKASGQSPWP